MTPLPEGVDAYISYNAWRVPPGTPVEEIEKHLTSILKQVKATAHVQAKAEIAAQERASKKPRKRTERKPRAKAQTGGTGEVSQQPDESGEASHAITTPATG